MFFITDMPEGNRATYKYRGTCFNIKKEEKYVDCNISTTETVNTNGSVEYKNSSWPTRFVGDAFAKAQELSDKDRIALVKFKMENIYSKEKGISYLRLVVFDFATAAELKAFDDAKKSVANTDPNA